MKRPGLHRTHESAPQAARSVPRGRDADRLAVLEARPRAGAHVASTLRQGLPTAAPSRTATVAGRVPSGAGQYEQPTAMAAELVRNQVAVIGAVSSRIACAKASGRGQSHRIGVTESSLRAATRCGLARPGGHVDRGALRRLYLAAMAPGLLPADPLRASDCGQSQPSTDVGAGASTAMPASLGWTCRSGAADG